MTSEIVTQTELLAAAITGAELSTPVPTCPGWNVGQLVRHVDGGHRSAADLVRSRATEPLTDVSLRDLSPFTDEDPAVLCPILIEGAEQLADALRSIDPRTPVWSPIDGGGAEFYARRFTHETAIHRADAELALGRQYTLSDDVAADGIEEWLELGSLPFHFEVHPWMRELLAPGRAISLRSTGEAAWVVDLTGDAITWRRGREDAAATVHGASTELLLMIYKRCPPAGPAVRIDGDRALLDFWLERVDFG